MITEKLTQFAEAVSVRLYIKRPAPMEQDWRLDNWVFPCIVAIPAQESETVQETSGRVERREFEIMALRSVDVTFDTAEADASTEIARTEVLDFAQQMRGVFHVEHLGGRQIWDSANGELIVGWSLRLRLTELVGESACGGEPEPAEIEITENGTYNVLPFGRAVVDVQGGTPAVVEPLEVEPTNEAQTFTPPAGVDGFAPVVVGACPVCPSPHIQPLSVTPSTNNQTFTPSAPVDGYGPVDVAAVDSTIDHNIQPQNIKAGVDILGVSGAYHGTIEPLNVSPSTSAQTITPPVGTDGYAPVTVDAVTAAIDANIQPGNVKKDVEILGVVGTMEPKPEGDEIDISYDGGQTFLTFVSTGTPALASGLSCLKLVLKGATELNRTTYNVGELCPKNLIATNATIVTNYALANNKLTSVTVGTLSTWSQVFGNTLMNNLRKVEVGQGTAINIAMTRWTATNVINEGQSGIDELNYNIKTYIADRVADRTNNTALTITFGAALYNVLTAETIAAFTAKNWNVASA